MFSRPSKRLQNVVCTFSLRPVSAGSGVKLAQSYQKGNKRKVADIYHSCISFKTSEQIFDIEPFCTSASIPVLPFISMLPVPYRIRNRKNRKKFEYWYEVSGSCNCNFELDRA